MFFKTAGKDGISKMSAQNHLPQTNGFFFPRPGADRSLCSAGPMYANRFPVSFPLTSEKLYH